MDLLHVHNFNVRLCKAVKKHPAIYNTDLKDYMNRETKERAWIEVGEEMKCDPKALKKKWKNFRTIFARKHKEKKYGINPDMKPHYLHHHLAFLTPFMKKTYQSPETIKNSSVKDTDSNHTADVEHEIHSNHDTEEDDDLQELYADPDPIYYIEDDDTLPPIDTPPPKNKRSYSSEEDDVQLNVPSPNSTQDHKRPKRLEVDNTRSPKKHFLLSLLPDLDEMSSAQMRQFKVKVIMLVEDILKDTAT